MTETSPVGGMAHPPVEVEKGTAEEMDWRMKSGRVLAGVQMRIVNDDGDELPGDGVAVGEMEVRGPWIAGGYHLDPSEEKFHDGWLRTGDIGTVDDRGFFQITDRSKDVIKSGGEWISSVELENLLAGSPDVLEAAVIGIPDDGGPDPKLVYLETITYGGTGCPQGSVGQSISTDRSTFTMIFDKYIAVLGPGVPITENRKNCQLNLQLHVPQGWQFSIYTSDFRGYVALDKGVHATHKSTYYFAGDSKQASSQLDYDGVIEEDYLAHDEIAVSSRIWSPCGASAALNVASQLRLLKSGGASDAQGQMMNDSQDGHFEHKLGFQWRACRK